ncbi:hypothetical protein [Rhabdothermincola salaria]|uniref:hypothetical protein n=1 Tax=Rhabdothermincola salaria TaxID=2903142 RepID=UPI001E5A204F|nr:hypothetical protein [Rhabdothermincola salaria]MCD9624228.1 hypothetical protein [Rhabdothermincola salaria]
MFAFGWASLVRRLNDWVVTILLAALLVGALVAASSVYNAAITRTEGSGFFDVEVKDRIPVIEVLLIVAAVVIGIWIRYAFVRTALFVARGEDASVVRVWNPTRIGPFAVLDIVLSAVWIGSWLLPFAGPLLWVAVTLYAPFLVMDRRGSGITSLWTSMTLTSRHRWFIPQLVLTTIGAFILAGAFGAATLVWNLGGGSLSEDLRNLASNSAVVAALAFLAVAAAVIMTAAAGAYRSIADASSSRS